MEEGRSASRGNRGPCTPRGLHLSTKSSPMVSMLLSMEDDEPSCNSWSPTAMRVDHRHALHFCCLDCPSMSALCHEPWSQLFLIPSSPPSMLSLIAGSSSMNVCSTSRTEHVLNHCSVWWNYLCNEWSFIPIGLRTKELRPFYFVSASCPELISERVTPRDLVVTPCTGLLKCWILMRWKEDLMELLNIQFSSFVHLWICA